MSVTSLLTNTLADTPPYGVANTATRTRFDPFGTPLTALPDTVPGTSEPGFGTVAGIRADTITPYGIIDMGARLYSTVLGRFLQVDPVPGGGVNAYAYPPDPVNMNDYSGRVATADAFVSWSNRGAKPSRDGNIRIGRGFSSYVGFARSAAGTKLANELNLAALALTVGAFVLVVVCTSCAIVAYVAGAASFARTAAIVASTGSASLSCLAAAISFDCGSSVVLGGLGSLRRYGETVSLGLPARGYISARESNGIALIGLGRFGQYSSNSLSFMQSLVYLSGQKQ